MITSIPTKDDWLPQLLEDESFLVYHSYYHTFRLNHKSHGIIALHRLGASTDFIKRYINEINKWLPSFKEHEEFDEDPEIDRLKSDCLEDYLGKNQGFYKILAMFTKLYETKYNKDIEAMIKDVCKDILDGPLYSAFHGIIHLGYGYIARSPQVMLEGVVTLYQRYSPLLVDQTQPKYDISRFGNGTTSFIKILNIIHDNNALIQQMKNENINSVKQRKEIHMFGVYGWAGLKYHSEYFMDLAHSLHLPSFFDASCKDMKQIVKLIDWWFDQVTYVYVTSKTVNDMFILHGPTSVWSARSILPLFDFDTALRGVRSLIASFFIVYATQGAPELCVEPEIYYEGDINEKAWDSLIQSLYGDQLYEAHVYKIIQCMHEYYMLDEISEYAKYYYAAANLVKNNHYSVIASAGEFVMKNTDLA